MELRIDFNSTGRNVTKRNLSEKVHRILTKSLISELRKGFESPIVDLEMALRARHHMFDAGFESPISKFITGFQSPISNSECRFLFQIGTKLINFVLKHINYQIN